MSTETVPPLPIDDLTIEAILQVAEGIAEEANRFGNPPFGAILARVDERHRLEFSAWARNEVFTSGLSSNHAELIAIRGLEARIGGSLGKYALFSPVESCSMCSSAAIKAGIRIFYFGARMESTAQPDVPVETVFRNVVPKPYVYFSPPAEAAIRAEQVRRARLGGGTDTLSGKQLTPDDLERGLSPQYLASRASVRLRRQ